MANITTEEASAAIQKAPRNKAPGPDGLSYEFYQTFFAELGGLMASVLTGALKEEAVPKSFRHSDVKSLLRPYSQDRCCSRRGQV